MGNTLTDWFRWFTRRAPTSEARMDVANSNLASIRLMGSFVIALETITLAYVLLVPEGQIQSRTASAMSVALILALCIVSIGIAHVLKRGEKTSVLAADALLVAIFVLATAWGIFASYRHYVVGEQIVTFYVVQLCFICFLLTKPLQSVIMYGGAFGTFYAMCVAFDGAPSLNVTNYVLFAVIAILGATVRYQTMIDVFARRRQIDELNEELRHTSTHDELTGLLNRMALRDRFESYLGHDLHVLILDVDHFKEFNDAFGHMAGDRVLVAVADAITDVFGEGCAYRFGGDEFLVILVDAADEDVRRKVDEWQRELLGISLEGVSRKIVCSAGMSYGTPVAPDDLRDMIEHADAKLYNDKAAHHAQATGE